MFYKSWYGSLFVDKKLKYYINILCANDKNIFFLKKKKQLKLQQINWVNERKHCLKSYGGFMQKLFFINAIWNKHSVINKCLHIKWP